MFPRLPLETFTARRFPGPRLFRNPHRILPYPNFFFRPTNITGVIDVPPGQVFNPNGVPYPGAFQPNTNSMYSFLNWGTRGWLSDRMNTDFAFRYQQDITPVERGSPQPRHP